MAAAALEADPEAGDEEPWLFRFARSCTTAEVWLCMGFSRVVVFSTANWADAAGAGARAQRGVPGRGQPIADLSRASTEALQAAIAPTFQRGATSSSVSRAAEALPPAAPPARPHLSACNRRGSAINRVHEHADWAEIEQARARARRSAS